MLQRLFHAPPGKDTQVSSPISIMDHAGVSFPSSLLIQRNSDTDNFRLRPFFCFSVVNILISDDRHSKP